MTSYPGSKNVTNGLIYSDNIFFAQAALKTEKINMWNIWKNLDLEIV